MTNTYRERLSKVQLSTFLNYATGWVMRVWREERMDGTTHHLPGRSTPDDDVTTVINRFVSFPVSPLALAKAVLDLERVTKVEVIDFAGFGEVLTKSHQ